MIDVPFPSDGLFTVIDDTIIIDSYMEDGMRFVGRHRELTILTAEAERLRAGEHPSGRCVMLRGRRRVGKSRLLEEFCERSGLPYAFYTASRQGDREPSLFAGEMLESTLPGKDLFADVRVTSWDAALRLLGAALDDDTPTIVVLDEFPYLLDDQTVEGVFQKYWDRVLSKKPVLLLLVGSDLAMMDALNTYGRPLYQRGTAMVLPPLSPVETWDIVGAKSAADAFDAYLATGGLPMVCDDWPNGWGIWRYLKHALGESTSALVVSGERALAAEFPDVTQARLVLDQIGSGERTFANLARAGGGMTATSLTRSLDVLITKGIVAKDAPLSTKRSRESRYRITDPYLRFWLRFIGPYLAEIERGRGDRVLSRIQRDWAVWRGRAIEPIIREALSRLSPIAGLAPAEVVGGYWTRTNVPEIDIIGADRLPVATSIAYAGTIKWLEKTPLNQADVNQLIIDLSRVPGASPSTPLIAVSRSGVHAAGVTVLNPDDLITAWAT